MNTSYCQNLKPSFHMHSTFLFSASDHILLPSISTCSFYPSLLLKVSFPTRRVRSHPPSLILMTSSVNRLLHTESSLRKRNQIGGKIKTLQNTHYLPLLFWRILYSFHKSRPHNDIPKLHQSRLGRVWSVVP